LFVFYLLFDAKLKKAIGEPIEQWNLYVYSSKFKKKMITNQKKSYFFNANKLYYCLYPGGTYFVAMERIHFIDLCVCICWTVTETFFVYPRFCKSAQHSALDAHAEKIACCCFRRIIFFHSLFVSLCVQINVFDARRCWQLVRARYLIRAPFAGWLSRRQLISNFQIWQSAGAL
jgi:hypothetical protein